MAARAMFQICMKPEDCSQVNLRNPAAAQVACCSSGGLPDEAHCLCLGECISAMPGLGTAAPQCLRWEELCGLAKRTFCKSCMACLSDGITTMARLLEDNVEHWGNCDFLKSSTIAHRNFHGRRTRSDPHLKEMAVSEALQTGQGSSTGQLVKSLALGSKNIGEKWVAEGLGNYQAA